MSFRRDDKDSIYEIDEINEIDEIYMINDITKPIFYQNDEGVLPAPHIYESEIDQYVYKLFQGNEEYLKKDNNNYSETLNFFDPNKIKTQLKKIKKNKKIKKIKKIKNNYEYKVNRINIIPNNYETNNLINNFEYKDKNEKSILINDDNYELTNKDEYKYKKINNILTNDELKKFIYNSENKDNKRKNNILTNETNEIIYNDKNNNNIQLFEENNEILYTLENNDKNNIIPENDDEILNCSKTSDIPVNETGLTKENNICHNDIKNNILLNESISNKILNNSDFKNNNNNVIIIIEKNEAKQKIYNNNSRYKKNKKSKKNNNNNNNNEFLEKKRFLFNIRNDEFEQSGNNYKSDSSPRPQNIRNKIIRNFIQDILLNWINNGEQKKNKIFQKLRKENLNYKCKGKKLFEIYKLSETDISNILNDKKYKNNFINNKSKENFYIKLHFYFEEAFKIFCYEKYKEEIYKNVRKRELFNYEEEENEQSNYKEFFNKFKSKQVYINEKAKSIKERDSFDNCFDELKSQYNISDE